MLITNSMGGKIYKNGGIYYLILLEEENTIERTMYWCSINKNKDELVNVTDYCICTPNAGWEYVETISDDQYTQALDNLKEILWSSKIMRRK